MSTIVLLHGALATEQQMLPLKALLGDHAVRSLTFSGHGIRAREPLDFMRFVDDIEAVVADRGSAPVHLFGYSMGGYAALLYAAKFPQRVRSVTTLGTIFAWSEEILHQELRKLDPAVIEQKVPAFARTLAAWHGEEQWRQVVLGIAAHMTGLARAPLLTPAVLKSIPCPVLCCVGDGDTGADPERTQRYVQDMPQVRTVVLANTKHPFETVDLLALVELLRKHWSASER
jgi:pimeloyl-ACP methyl ester carboxylesterase